MKVLFLASWYPKNDSDSAGKFVKVQAEALKSLVDLRVFDCSHRVPLAPHRLQDRILYLQILKKTKSWIPDVIHAHAGYPAGKIGLMLKEKWNRPLVVTEHTGPINLLEPYFGTFKDQQEFYDQCDGLIAVSQFQRREIGKYVQKEIAVIGNIVEKKYFDLPPPKKGEFISLAFVGSLTQAKGAKDLVEFAAAYKGPLLNIRILGKGPYENEIRKMKAGQVRFKLFDPARVTVSEILAGSHGLLLMSEVETFSLVAAESLASGRPVFGFDCGGPKDFVTTPPSCLVPNRDIRALSKVVAGFAESTAKADNEYIQTCQDSVRHFEDSKIAKDLFGFYQRWV